MSSTGKKYAFVPPRFGRSIAGGAETLIGELARKLSARGDRIEILTLVRLLKMVFLFEGF